VKCDQQQQTHLKNDVSNYGTNLQKIILNSPITILPMFLAGEFSHMIEAVFCWVQGVFMGLDYMAYGNLKCYVSDFDVNN
jgi:hypothetical protein